MSPFQIRHAGKVLIATRLLAHRERPFELRKEFFQRFGGVWVFLRFECLGICLPEGRGATAKCHTGCSREAGVLQIVSTEHCREPQDVNFTLRSL